MHITRSRPPSISYPRHSSRTKYSLTTYPIAQINGQINKITLTDQISTTIQPSDDPTDDAYPRIYEQSLDRLACAVGGKAALPAAFQLIPGMLVRRFHLGRLRSPWSFSFFLSFSLLLLSPSADSFRPFIHPVHFWGCCS